MDGIRSLSRLALLFVDDNFHNRSLLEWCEIWFVLISDCFDVDIQNIPEIMVIIENF